MKVKVWITRVDGKITRVSNKELPYSSKLDQESATIDADLAQEIDWDQRGLDNALKFLEDELNERNG
jgi:hypothetical protein